MGFQFKLSLIFDSYSYQRELVRETGLLNFHKYKKKIDKTSFSRALRNMAQLKNMPLVFLIKK